MKLLFLCTGNSCRSQMAEGWARHHGRGIVTATSAGIEAHGVNKWAVEAMTEVGIDISGQSSKTVSPEMIATSDLIITVCDHAREHCPVVPGHIRQVHWSFDDPAKAQGTEEEIRSTFKRVRDEIGIKVQSLIGELRGQRVAGGA